MPRVAPRVPELSEILCSSCGYVLNGLSQTGVCPECGKPIAQSLDEDRKPPPWETAERSHRSAAFVQTTRQIIFRPAQFYRTLNVRGSLESARSFARIHWAIAGALFGIAGATHAVFFSSNVVTWPGFPGGPWALFSVMLVGCSILTYFSLDWITRLAARLTTWEATYRGIRLPLNVVLRGMYYHAAQYLPVALAATLVVEGYQFVRLLFFERPMIYLYTLSGMVVILAVYLFQAYWIGMRNMMYANR